MDYGIYKFVIIRTEKPDGFILITTARLWGYHFKAMKQSLPAFGLMDKKYFGDTLPEDYERKKFLPAF